ncbi:hypothetical protein LH612_33310, partial [Klebsiella pneumoniae]|nr:hypothetical protein [Klebsiella pneumoniae]
RDTEDLHGVFSGFDTETASYDTSSWQYADGQQRPREAETSPSKEHGRERETSRPERAGSGGPSYSGTAHTDPTLQHPRCVFQILKRHYARYTPEMVEQVCGVPRELFQQVAETLVRNSGPERTSAFAYAVGWTHHTVGVQYIRAASILQLLLGNIG